MDARRERAGYRVERQLLALLSLFACLSVAAMTAVGLDLIAVPVWALTGAIAASFILCAWLAVRLLRRRFALLNRLELLTRRIARGEYGQRVTVKAHDEFQSLGMAFNEMTDQLQASLKSSQSVADIDRLILSSADLDTVVRKVLLTARMEAVEICLLLRRDADKKTLAKYHLQDRQLVEEPIGLLEISDDSLRDEDGYRRIAQRVCGDSVLSCLPVAADGAIVNVIALEG